MPVYGPYPTAAYSSPYYGPTSYSYLPAPAPMAYPPAPVIIPQAMYQPTGPMPQPFFAPVAKPALKPLESAPAAISAPVEKTEKPAEKLLEIKETPATETKTAQSVDLPKSPREVSREKWVGVFRNMLTDHPEWQQKLDESVTPDLLDKLQKAKTPEDFFHVGLDSPVGKEFLTKMKSKSKIVRWPLQKMLGQMMPKSFSDLLNKHLSAKKDA